MTTNNPETKNKERSRKPWTEEEVEELKKYLGKYHASEIAEMLGRTRDSIYLFAKKTPSKPLYWAGMNWLF